jgi:hypothetical protein
MSRSSPRRDQRPTDHQGDENAQAASPCNVQGLVLHNEIHDKRVTDCLEARSAYAPPTDERGCRVECNLIALFRLLVFYGHFLDKHEMYWTYIAQDIGWPRNVAENITSIYVRARFKFLTRVTRRLGTDSAHAQRSSGTLCTVIDQYIELARSHNDRVDRREPPLLLTESREKYIADTRDAFKKMNPTSLVQAAPSPPAPPQNPDWLPASRSRSRSPRVPDAQQNNNAYRQRSPTNGHPPAPKQEPIEQPRGAHAEPAPLDSGKTPGDLTYLDTSI